MYHVAHTESLTSDGIITSEQARVIEERARQAMVSLSINSLLCAGILASALGMVFFLADAVAVAVFGFLALGVGILILRSGTTLYNMFGNALSLIGSGMLMSGLSIEMLDKYATSAPYMLGAVGVIAAALGGFAMLRGRPELHFSLGALGLMGVAMHLVGLYFGFGENDVSGLPLTMLHLYATALIIGAGIIVDQRLITALAIAPFAQALDVGSAYFNAAYVFYSPESTLSILQMSVAIALSLWLGSRLVSRYSRHTGIFAVMAFIVANMCFLVGSLWGDVVGETYWGLNFRPADMSWEDYRAAREALRATALNIHEHVFSVVWALLLAATIAWAAFSNRRGLFNAAMTFAGIHAYTQMFESFGDEPLAYVIGGLVAIPAAWGLWRLNERFESGSHPTSS